MPNPMQINFEEIDSYIKHEFCYEAQQTEFDIKEPTPNYASINDFIKEADDILQDNIRNLILSKQLDEVEVYKKADVDRKLFSKI